MKCRMRKAFNAMMSHYLIQAFAEHEKQILSFCKRAEYFLLCLYFSPTHRRRLRGGEDEAASQNSFFARSIDTKNRIHEPTLSRDVTREIIFS